MSDHPSSFAALRAVLEDVARQGAERVVQRLSGFLSRRAESELTAMSTHDLPVVQPRHGAPAGRTPLQRTLAYHQRTKHHPHRFATSLGYLDWDTQPDPFRRYKGAQLLPLDLVEPADEPGYESAFWRGLLPSQPITRRTVSVLFQDSLALSAWKQVTDPAGQVLGRWALRVNPSSGNLHPTEGYLIAGPIPGLAERPAVYHYAPHEHGLELRRQLGEEEWRGLSEQLPPNTLLIGLTSVYWRESWKYGERAFRYCHHDVGHAIAAVSIAAAGLGWDAVMLENLLDPELASLLGIASQDGIEAEHPDCLLAITSRERPSSSARSERLRLPPTALEPRSVTWHGAPNQLSHDHQEWPIIDDVGLATEKVDLPSESLWDAERAAKDPLAIEGSPHSLRRIIQQRRSAVALDGRTGLTRNAFYKMLLKVVPGRDQVPFYTLPWRPRIDLALLVHRVQDVEPGLYLLLRDSSRQDSLRAAMDPRFVWERPPACPGSLPLFLLRSGDHRGTADGISCGQSIAADGAFAVAMLAEYRSSLETLGPWFYRRLHWEAGLVGQVLYLEAEAAGIRATGIGCFFDDSTHDLLGLKDDQYVDIYHFTMGSPIDDPRLQTRPPYAHLDSGSGTRGSFTPG